MRELNAGDSLSNRYIITRTLAQGGFGKTYIAQDTQRPGHPECVVKQFKPKESHPKFLETAHRLFDTEASTLERLGYHDQIPRLLAHFQEGGEFFLVQEFINGEPLTEEIIPGRPWTEEKIIKTLQEILQVLSFIHENNVIHRDIKPDNIIRRYSDQKLVLVDFGTVKQVRSQLISSSHGYVDPTVAVGTHGYMPVEQIRGNPHLNSDIYALGIIGIQAATGLSISQLQEDPGTGEIVWQPWARISNDLIAVLERMTRYHFRDRYQSAKEVLADLVRLNTSEQESPVVAPDSHVSNQTLPTNFLSKESIASDLSEQPEIINKPADPTEVSSVPTIDNRQETLISQQPPDNPSLPIIGSPNTPQETLISQQPQGNLSSPVTRNPSTPQETLISASNPVSQAQNHPQSNGYNASQTPLEGQRWDLQFDPLQILKLSSILGAGGWLIAVCLISLLGTIWLATGFWLVIVAGFIFGFLANKRVLSDKIIWLVVSIICTLLAVMVVPGSFDISSLATSSFLSWMVIVVITVFSCALAFILLAIAQSLFPQ